MKILCDGLPDYAYVGVGRDDGKTEGEYSPVFYRKDRFELLDSGHFWLSETPDVPSKGWDAACIRICTWAVLRERESGKAFAQFNTHLDHVSEQARDRGITMVLDKIKSFDIPVMCTGDFNTDENSTAYRIMTGDVMGDSKYLAECSDSGNTFTNFDPEGTKNDSPIDFIFVKRKAVSVAKYKIMDEPVDGKLPSDHHAIYADVSF